MSANGRRSYADCGTSCSVTEGGLADAERAIIEEEENRILREVIIRALGDFKAAPACDIMQVFKLSRTSPRRKNHGLAMVIRQHRVVHLTTADLLYLLQPRMRQPLFIFG